MLFILLLLCDSCLHYVFCVLFTITQMCFLSKRFLKHYISQEK
jgi:hypothetical protein